MADPASLGFRHNPYDVFVIGGGIQGAGVARDAALRGLSVCLAEKADFAHATSSASSKLIHGGLRYLERLEFRLVYESLAERHLLLQDAPHLVKPLWFTIPLFRKSRRRPWQYRIGLGLYDLFAGSQSLGSYQYISNQYLAGQLPFLIHEETLGGLQYMDGQMDDVRLVLACIKDAQAAGARCLSYTPVVSCRQIEAPTLFELQLNGSCGSEKIWARTVVNASGPWAQDIQAMLGRPQRFAISQAKGVHLVVAGPAPLSSALLLEVPGESRIFFVLPWKGRCLVGTTDTPYQQAMDLLQVSDQDVDYLLRALSYYVRPSWLRASSLTGLMAGVRPLVSRSSALSQDLSRDYLIDEYPHHMWHVLGGKYTVFRKIAEQVVDAICQRLKISRSGVLKRFSGAPVTAWSDYLESSGQQAYKQFPHKKELFQRLIVQYGTDWEKLADLIAQDPELVQPISTGTDRVLAEVVFAIRYEFARSIDDVLTRRLGLSYTDNHCLDAVDAVAAIVQAERSLSDHVMADQRAEFVTKTQATTHAMATMPHTSGTQWLFQDFSPLHQAVRSTPFNLWSLVQQPLVFAHRGQHQQVPENTLAAFEQALQSGAQGIECDVRLSSDGVPMIYHDISAKRLCGDGRRVSRLSMAQLKKLSFINAPEHSIPSLDELFDILPRDVFLYLEIKDDEGQGEIWQRTLDLVRYRQGLAQVCFCSFHLKHAQKFKKLHPTLYVGGIVNHLPRWALRRQSFYPELDVLSFDHHHLQASCIALARRQKQTICAWTVNHWQDARRCRSLGVDMMVTDHIAWINTQSLSLDDPSHYSSPTDDSFLRKTVECKSN